MKRLIAIVLLLALPAPAIAEDCWPAPDYHRQPSDPEWLAQVVQLHGHLGPSVVAGARMGMIGLRAVGAKGYFDVEVTCEGPMARPPQSCFLDGIQAATGATLGKRTLAWVQADRIAVRIGNTRTGQTVELRPTPMLLELLGSFKSQPKAGTGPGPGQQDHERSEAIARKIATMPEQAVAGMTMVGGKEANRAAAPHVARESIEWADIWIPEANATTLPRVLLIGDSITRGYYPKVVEQLKGKASVARLASSKSIGDPALLAEVALVLDQCRFDVVHFNNGLHGWGYSEDEYQKHFPGLVATLRRHAPKAKLIWAATTPMRQSGKLHVMADGRRAGAGPEQDRRRNRGP